jgi:hypothetical protein
MQKHKCSDQVLQMHASMHHMPCMAKGWANGRASRNLVCTAHMPLCTR